MDTGTPEPLDYTPARRPREPTRVARRLVSQSVAVRRTTTGRPRRDAARNGQCAAINARRFPKHAGLSARATGPGDPHHGQGRQGEQFRGGHRHQKGQYANRQKNSP